MDTPSPERIAISSNQVALQRHQPQKNLMQQQRLGQGSHRKIMSRSDIYFNLPASSTFVPHLDPGNTPHNCWEPQYTHSAKCDTCHEHNANIIRRCWRCNVQLCKKCIVNPDNTPNHVVNEEELDWSLHGARRKEATKTQHGSDQKSKGLLQKLRTISTAITQRPAQTRNPTADSESSPSPAAESPPAPRNANSGHSPQYLGDNHDGNAIGEDPQLPELSSPKKIRFSDEVQENELFVPERPFAVTWEKAKDLLDGAVALSTLQCRG